MNADSRATHVADPLAVVAEGTTRAGTLEVAACHLDPSLAEVLQLTGFDKVLGWEPRVDYAAGLEATLAWLRAEPLEGQL